jgi:hypothetical protein
MKQGVNAIGFIIFCYFILVEFISLEFKLNGIQFNSNPWDLINSIQVELELEFSIQFKSIQIEINLIINQLSFNLFQLY